MTPAEHLALPNEHDVREGVRVTRLAVKIGDLCKYPHLRKTEMQASMARRDMRWQDLEKYLLFPQVARQIRCERTPEEEKTCTMCGDFCAMKKGMEIFQENITQDKMCDF
jgi:phosphomethylpyrimidine synthase